MESIKSYSVVGVMSGTSLDGIDFCWVEFTESENWKFQIKAAETISYHQNWIDKLKEAHTYSKNELHQLNQDYSAFLSAEITEFISRKKITNLDFVASHGHTILHQPENGITLQIGNLATVTNRLKVPVICDFRVQDVQLGGQGAPLVPIGDKLLFTEFDACLNLGGFANISFQKNRKRTAYDICPVNIVLNHFAEKLNFPYDENGEIAKANQVHRELLETLNLLPFYFAKSPKSLGKEWVETLFLPVVNQYQLQTEVILATLTHHAAIQITQHLQPEQRVLITGGGAFNQYLIEILKASTSAEIILPKKELINYKEALIFAFLGVLKHQGKTNVLASVTGAAKNHSSGVIHFPS